MLAFKIGTKQKHGRLTLVSTAGKNKHGKTMVNCACDCGERITIQGSDFKNEHTHSCGCLMKEKLSTRNFVHGHGKREQCTVEYRAYKDAKDRCTNSNHKRYADYGERGIEFRFTSFQEFIDHIGLKPSPELTLDRIENDGHYEVGNVRWATALQQANNRRKPKPRKLPIHVPTTVELPQIAAA